MVQVPQPDIIYSYNDAAVEQPDIVSPQGEIPTILDYTGYMDGENNSYSQSLGSKDMWFLWETNTLEDAAYIASKIRVEFIPVFSNSDVAWTPEIKAGNYIDCVGVGAYLKAPNIPSGWHGEVNFYYKGELIGSMRNITMISE